jgi:hypothetical protein
MEQAPVKKEQPAQVQVQPAAPMNNEFMKRSGPEAPKDDIPAFGEDEDWTAVPAFLRRGKK